MHLLCLGDSITDCGRSWENPPLGNGYVKMIADQLKSFNPDYEITNCGTDGFTIARVTEVVRRMGFSFTEANTSRSIPSLSAVAPAFPPYNIITLLIGINDIALMMNTCRTSFQQTEMLRKFFKHYEALICLLTNLPDPAFAYNTEATDGPRPFQAPDKDYAALCRRPRLILMEPFIFQKPAEFALWLPHVQSMSRGIASLAGKYGLHYVRLQAPLEQAAAKQGTDAVTIDGIHLTEGGHRILADALMPLFFLP